MGKELVFPGSPTFYTRFDSFTYSSLHAKFNLWAALEQSPHISNQAFNVVDGEPDSWANMWPKVARKFGLKVPERMFSAEEEAGKFGEGSVMELAPQPPLRESAAGHGLKDTTSVHRSRVEQKINLVKWSQRSDVKEAWQTLAKREGSRQDAFEQATWIFWGGFVLGRNYDIVISMKKARKAGWMGYQDSWEALDESLDELAEEKVLPTFKSNGWVSTVADYATLGMLRGRDSER